MTYSPSPGKEYVCYVVEERFATGVSKTLEKFFTPHANSHPIAYRGRFSELPIPGAVQSDRYQIAPGLAGLMEQARKYDEPTGSRKRKMEERPTFGAPEKKPTQENDAPSNVLSTKYAMVFFPQKPHPRFVIKSAAVAAEADSSSSQ